MNTTKNLQHIELCRISPSRTPLRPVRKKDPEFTELMESIRTDDVLQPILVRPDKKKGASTDYEVVEGNYRYAAAKLVGLKTIPCQIKELTDREVLIIQLKAQAVRPQETKPFEYARRLKKLLDDGLTINDLAAIVDKGPGWVKSMLSLNRLSEKCQHELNSGNLKVSNAIRLATLPRHLQEIFLDDAVKMKMVPFQKRVSQAKRDYDAFLLEQTQGQHEEGVFPRMRGLKDIMLESETFEAAEQVLTSCNATTPEMGWKACLAWIMRIDPVTVKNRKAGVKEKRHEYLSAYEIRLKQRRMIENLTFDTIKDTSGD